jgi:hypothetical protein
MHSSNSSIPTHKRKRIDCAGYISYRSFYENPTVVFTSFLRSKRIILLLKMRILQKKPWYYGSNNLSSQTKLPTQPLNWAMINIVELRIHIDHDAG